MLSDHLSWEESHLRGVAWATLEAAEQSSLRRSQQNPRIGHLLFSEPNPTYTAGRRAKASDLLWPKEELKRRGIHTTEVARGGHWTYHGPGQLLLFPIVSLRALGYEPVEARRFVDALREKVRHVLSCAGVESMPGEKPYGLYVKHRKLVSFGLRIERGFAAHGCAIYLKNQAEPFRGILPCASTTAIPISLQELGISLEWETAAQMLSTEVKKGF